LFDKNIEYLLENMEQCGRNNNILKCSKRIKIEGQLFFYNNYSNNFNFNNKSDKIKILKIQVAAYH
jgi:hypothetical protein